MTMVMGAEPGWYSGRVSERLVAISQLPGLGALVFYMLDEADAEAITAWRENFAAFNAGMSGHKHPHRPGVPGSTGHIAHVGSPVRAGDVRPAWVDLIPDPESGRLNLKVSLDGNDFRWVTGVPPGDGPGEWTEAP
jgi:hypothetical protein